MKDSNKVDCKANKCFHSASKPSGFCGWCDKKYKSGELLADGRASREVCKASDCERPSTADIWCGYCIKRFEKGDLTSDGQLTLKASKRIIAKKKRQERIDEAKKKRQGQKLKKELKLILNIEKLKIIALMNEEYRRTFDCPYLQIQIDSASCFNRMFIKPRTKNISACKKCDIHNDKLEILRKRLEIIDAGR